MSMKNTKISPYRVQVTGSGFKVSDLRVAVGFVPTTAKYSRQSLQKYYAKYRKYHYLCPLTCSITCLIVQKIASKIT